MTSFELQGLLSLSTMSILGPRYDIDSMMGDGFYKSGAMKYHLDKDLSTDKATFGKYSQQISSFISNFGINDRNSYIEKIEELLEGSSFSSNMDKLFQLSRMMSVEERGNVDTILVNRSPYPKIMIDTVLDYELHWPLQGLIAYDIANGIMLLRLGIHLGYIDSELQMGYFTKFLEILKGEYTNYHDFGVDACIGRNLHICTLELTRNNQLPKEILSVLSECYFGIWQYIETDLLEYVDEY